jgi:hypothetical protein
MQIRHPEESRDPLAVCGEQWTVDEQIRHPGESRDPAAVSSEQ